MAMYASLSLDTSAVYPGTVVGVTVTVRNGGESSVAVTEVTPTLTPLNSAATMGQVRGPSLPATVEAGESVSWSWSAVMFAPQSSSSRSALYDLSAMVFCDDGSALVPTAVSPTASGLGSDVPAPGELEFAASFNSALLAAIVDTTSTSRPWISHSLT